MEGESSHEPGEPIELIIQPGEETGGEDHADPYRGGCIFCFCFSLFILIIFFLGYFFRSPQIGI